MLFKISCDDMPTLYFNEEYQDKALEKFHKGLSDKKYMEIVNDESFTISVIDTLTEFLENCPKEFSISEDTSF